MAAVVLKYIIHMLTEACPGFFKKGANSIFRGERRCFHQGHIASDWRYKNVCPPPLKSVLPLGHIRQEGAVNLITNKELVLSSIGVCPLCPLRNFFIRGKNILF